MGDDNSRFNLYHSYQVRGRILNNLNKETEDRKRLYEEYMKCNERHNKELEKRNETLNKNYASERDRINKWNAILRERIIILT